jgi:hypothetical protein
MTTKLSQLSAASALAGTERIETTQGGATLYTTPAQLRTYVAPLVAQARTTGSNTFVAGDTRINYNTVLYDPSSTITTGASWIFTVPATGYYMFVASECDTDANGSDWALSDTIKLYLYKSTSTYLAQIGYKSFDVATTAAAQTDIFTDGIGVVSLTAAETCHVKYRNLTGASRILNSGAQLTILRVA